MFSPRMLAVATLVLTPIVFANVYSIKDTYIGDTFLETWNWETIDDPTSGRVNYLDKDTAILQNITFASKDKFIMRADSTKVVPNDARGRDSVRITSKAVYTDAVMVLDLAHMPEGCTTWPAWWTLSQASPWPYGGEIDIIEGVNRDSQNLVSMHTSANCTVRQTRFQTGKTVSTNCDVASSNNQGCGTRVRRPFSFGSAFNQYGGGWYIMERSQQRGVNVWFWSRDDPLTPISVREGLDIIVPNLSWGLPDATFPTDTCDFESHFNAHMMIFDLTFCGDFAGSLYPESGCGPSSCVDFVNNNPEQFKEAYWEINALRVYEPAL